MTPMPDPRPTSWRFALDSLRYHRRIAAALAGAVVIATAVLTGALVIGDSMRGSLRSLALDRLGRIDDCLVVDRFFRVELADEFERSMPTAVHEEVVAAIILPGTLEQPDSHTRANRVMLIGYDEHFWQLGSDPAPPALANDDIVLNEPLAAELGVKVGEDVIVRLPTPSDIPRDSPLGHKTETITNRRAHVKAIVPARGLGAFNLFPTQQLPHNAYLNREALAKALDEPHRANALLVAGRSQDVIPAADADSQRQSALHPTLDDLGLTVRQTPRGYINLGSRRMLLDNEAVGSALTEFAADHPQPVMTYLANTIAIGKREIPYSTISALDFTAEPPLGPFETIDGKPAEPLGENEIAINTWAAEQLGAKLGDEVQLKYFEPESTHGQVRETSRTFRLKAILKLAGAAADPELTPELKGVTDQLSISDWNPPFPFEPKRVRDIDEKYWDDHKATPKAFVALRAGQAMWGSRFGNTTSIRVAPTKALTVESVAARWQPGPVKMGFELRPVKRLAFEASAGTTPFDGLFLGFSFYLIVAAVMLVALLFRLSIERRAAEIGTLAAIGFTPRHIAGLLICEGAAISLVAAIIGAGVGVGYAWLMLWGLRTWWLPAIGAPFVRLFVSPGSLFNGIDISILVCLGAIIWGLWPMRRVPVRQLLAGQGAEAATDARTTGRLSFWVARISLALAAITSLAGLKLGGMAQAGAFFAAGFLAMFGVLAIARRVLVRGATGSVLGSGPTRLLRLALRNAARNPGRSTLSIGLVAAASFLLVAVSAFHLRPPEDYQRRDSGTGGFALVAESDQPILSDLNTEDGRADMGISSSDDKTLAAAHVYACRLQPGSDASCLNLYQAQQPRCVGLPKALLERGGFGFNGWPKLDSSVNASTPVVLDQATAQYALHVGVGDTLRMPDGRGNTIPLLIVGLVEGSILQGMVLMDERRFLAHFPDAAGYRFFLIDAPPDKVRDVEQALERSLSDFGFDAQPTVERLANLATVQNTYLSTFQSLGGLGLLLGTLGLATVQLRAVFERRGELALMRATGFSRRQLVELVLFESAALLLAGLGVGVATALIAIAPQLFGGAASVPWRGLSATLGLVLVAGLAASTLAARAVVRMPLVESLRGE